ncbi:MAG TPA: DUF2007 domain-containing protein [Gemmataceae bacterium]|nr:DUF2007 domain-containing protein [Gemmataceae bacterium]
MENEDLISVYTVKSTAEAEIVRGSLESVGIPCQIGGESQAGFSGVLEIDILTHVSDADRARKHLRLLRKEKKERRQRRLEAKKAREAETHTGPSDAIQALPRPPLPSTDFMEKGREDMEE